MPILHKRRQINQIKDQINQLASIEGLKILLQQASMLLAGPVTVETLWDSIPKALLDAVPAALV